jgi:hypothetical protein
MRLLRNASVCAERRRITNGSSERARSFVEGQREWTNHLAARSTRAAQPYR